MADPAQRVSGITPAGSVAPRRARRACSRARLRALLALVARVALLAAGGWAGRAMAGPILESHHAHSEHRPPSDGTPVAGALTQWDGWQRVWESGVVTNDPAARALQSGRRDSIAEQLTAVLATEGLGADGDSAGSAWVHARILEGLQNDDPRFLAFAERPDTPVLAPRWDPTGACTLPAVLALSHHGKPAAARAWCRSAVIDFDDAAFVNIVHIETELALSDTAAAAALAGRILAEREWPGWAEEPLREALILGAIQTRDAAVGGLLADYGRRFTPGPWYLGTAGRWARIAGDGVRADSLEWEIARQYPASRAARSLLEKRTTDAAGDTPAELRVLLTVAEAHDSFDRFVSLSERLDRLLPPAAHDSLSLRGLQLGYRLKRYSDALGFVKNGRWSAAGELRGAWAQTLARTYRNSGALDSMETWFAVAEKEADLETAARCLYEWGRELESAREFVRAAAVYERLMARSPERRAAAAFRAGLCRYRLGDWDGSRRLLEAADVSGDAEERAAARFWLARGAIAGEEPTRAEAIWNELTGESETSATYYGLRARTAALANPGSVALAVTDLIDYWDWVARVADRPALSELRALPEMDEGRPWEPNNHGLPRPLNRAAERLMLFRQFGRSTWAARALDALDTMPELGTGRARVTALHQLGFPDLAARRTIRSGYPDQQLRYPAPYGAAVLSACLRWSLAPEWVWSIMRRESFFERTVRSGAGAIGLMQFMPGTALEVARDHGLPSEPLRAPYVNLRLGVAHLHDLRDEVSDAWPVVLAAYNAGIDNARRWRHEDDDLDLYIENIGYRETRDYVKAVLQGYWIYREILRGRLGEAP